MKIVKRLLLLALFLVIGIVFLQYPKLAIISGYAAKNMSSVVFLANRTEASVNQKDNNIPLVKLAEVELDKESQSALASVFGLNERKAIYREGIGSALLNSEAVTERHWLKPQRTFFENALPFPYGNQGIRDSIFEEVNYTLIEKAVSNAFAKQEVQKTRSVLVVYKDHVIAERYAEGFGPETRLPGWSMTKSVLATLFGILQYQGRIDINQRSLIPYWSEDRRNGISLNHLLRMQSGLEWDEDYTTISDVTRMLFLEDDMSVVQAKKKLIADPGEIWNYSSGTSNLLSGILRRQFDDYQEYLNFPYEAMIDKMGMHSMIIEADMAGNFVGSSYGWASTRDWAKLGLLYLHRGNWKGEQLFAPEWTDYIRRPTKNSEGAYGAHFWLNAGGKYPDVPRDLFSANGYQGQYVFVIPSADLVVVRTGLAEGKYFDVNQFLKQILAAFQ